MKEKKPVNVAIGRNVKKVREAASLTQEEFAEMIDLGVKHISAIECGAVGVSLPTLIRICELLRISADSVLFGMSETPRTRQKELQLIVDRLEHLSDKEFNVVKSIFDAVFEAISLNEKKSDATPHSSQNQCPYSEG